MLNDLSGGDIKCPKEEKEKEVKERKEVKKSMRTGDVRPGEESKRTPIPESRVSGVALSIPTVGSVGLAGKVNGARGVDGNLTRIAGRVP